MDFDIKNFLVFAIAILYALTIHEFFHAWAANRLGDPTAKMQGRLTLNPIAHLDPLGTICFIFAHFGWGKPVPINSNNFKNPRRDDVIVSAAGPISNFVSAFILGLLFQILYKFDVSTNFFLRDIYKLLFMMVRINLILAIFNFIPLYPLDGSHILKGFLPRHLLPQYEEVCRYGPFILLGLILLGNFAGVPILSSILYPPMLFFSELFTGLSLQ
ncbi:MAG: site-2 protease family protein [Candidatus Scalindua sp. AMX11]|nr:MAG: site-2 protease family protein [Candidatus Scalindua sp.]NOG83846.1 site-2 protease family protein [Planctomycetota bacterium]RZV82998.1 MAG: site-2 protease family protein [Candidatus Scalindua sp. SCAELEC01]TDE64501.1 MAG: site-2 protease family protein [Candidatus Scalindua sp. AMX11]